MQTPVEFLKEQYDYCPRYEEQIHDEDWDKALEIEKEQIKDAYLNGRYEADKIVMGHSFYAKQYYNETFKQQEQ